MPLSDHWYLVVNDASLRQGDIFRNVAAFLLPQDVLTPAGAAGEAAPNAIAFERVTGDWIVLDASCDVDYGPNRPPSCQHVLLASVRAATRQALKTDVEKEFNVRLEVMRKGLMPSRFLLAAHDDAQIVFPLSFVQYSARVLVPHAYLLRHCDQPRLRLKSPHRESFGNWAAACISRVGAEEEAQIPRFVPQLHAGQVVAAVDTRHD